MVRITRAWPAPNLAGALMLLVLLACAALVIYPVVFIVAESLNIGEPGVFPPGEISLRNFAAITDDVRIIGNTLLVAGVATVIAVIVGFVLAWILSRTNIPGRSRLERLMELPYYMTPLVGAMAWGILAAPKNGLLNQLWRVSGGGGDAFDIYSPFGIAWVMALFEGTVAS